MGIPIHFLLFSDESRKTFVLLMKMSQFFQETCKTNLYENSKKPGPSARANFYEFYENLQGGWNPPPPTKIGLNTTLEFCSSFCSRYGLMTSNKENIAFHYGNFVVRYGVGNVMYSIWRQCLVMQSSKVDMKHLPWSLEVAFIQVILVIWCVSAYKYCVNSYIDNIKK